MTEAISDQEFHDADGVDDWRPLYWGVYARFETGDFATGVRFVEQVGALADAADHHPDVDLRYGSVTLRLITHEVGALTRRDVDLARQISIAARDLGLTADPTGVQVLQPAIDAMDIPAVKAFWEALLGYRDMGPAGLVDPHGRGQAMWFQQMDAPRPQRNRIHFDLCVAPEEAQLRIERAIAAGGRLVDDTHAPSWWTLADPEGNEVDIATWQGQS